MSGYSEYQNELLNGLLRRARIEAHNWDFYLRGPMNIPGPVTMNITAEIVERAIPYQNFGNFATVFMEPHTRALVVSFEGELYLAGKWTGGR